ncbi:MAG: hybrid sensor histidine kinase/response regulator [Coleofasciculaceae cyanobacterium SM2_3_26]|nr:hybrid sensor histidine kinase/response regulator [Coleofasciculaceae cyanobacterium SM2_3_26]
MNISEQPLAEPLILIVDDERSTRMILRRIMQREGYRAIEASNGIEALEIFQHNQPDIILLDGMMPEMDGFDCCRRMVAMSDNPPAVIAITALEDEDSVTKAFEAGASDYITKPINLAVLRQRVRLLLREKLATDRMKQALERERELSELRSRIITMISHEYRTPLTVILSSAELLDHYGYKWDEEKKRKYLHRIQHAAHHMSELIDDMFYVSNLREGRISFCPHSVNVVSLCREVMDQARSTATPAHQLAFSIDRDSLQARWDEKIIRQLLTHLLSNAIKYSPKGGEVCLHVTYSDAETATGGTIKLEVCDRGMGISEEDFPNIFHTFYRGQNAELIPGTGLGLTIVKSCVEMHGGTIAIDSHLEEGTQVTVTLPAIARGDSRAIRD